MFNDGSLKVLNPVTVAVAAVTTQLLAANPDRYGIIINGPAADRYSLGLGVAAVLDSGITLDVGSDPYVIAEEQVGSAIAGVIDAISAGLGQNVIVIEIERT